jgi:hypothetical protein
MDLLKAAYSALSTSAADTVRLAGMLAESMVTTVNNGDEYEQMLVRAIATITPEQITALRTVLDDIEQYRVDMDLRAAEAGGQRSTRTRFTIGEVDPEQEDADNNHGQDDVEYDNSPERTAAILSLADNDGYQRWQSGRRG